MRMLWKSITCAAVLGISLAGPASASQETTKHVEENVRAKPYQSVLSATKTTGVTDIGDGHDDWSSIVASDGTLSAPFGKYNMAGVLSRHIIPGQTFAGPGASELVEAEAEFWQQLMMNGSDNFSSIGDAQIITDNLPMANDMVGETSGRALSPSS